MDPDTGDAPGPVRTGDPARTAYLPPIWGGQRSCRMRRSLRLSDSSFMGDRDGRGHE